VDKFADLFEMVISHEFRIYHHFHIIIVIIIIVILHKSFPRFSVALI